MNAPVQVATAPTAAAVPTAAPRPKRKRKWPRAVAPFVVVFVLFLVTAIAHWTEEPDLGDPGTLSPTGTGPDGSSRLAQLLADRGVTVTRVATQAEAVAAAGDSDATIFVPTPGFLRPSFYQRLADAPGRHEVVIAAPGGLTLAVSSLPVLVTGSRWAARAVSPGCDQPVARAAGAAAVLRNRYLAYEIVGDELRAAPPLFSCYRGALLGVQFRDLDVTLVGAHDPFRNSRIREHGNAALATGLLAGSGRVIWVDVHKREPAAAPDIDIELPDFSRPDRDRTGTSLFKGVPPLLPAVLAVLLATAVLIALARARRLGPPVAEPLPVVVPAIETVAGRGRLYQRARARGATLDTLRAAAIARLTAALGHVGLIAPLDSDAVLDQVAARTGIARDQVRHLLFGPEPENDDELAAAVAQLDAVERAVVGTVHRGGQP